MSRISRRSFVQGTLAAPFVLPTLAQADQKKEAANNRIGIGMIGMGTMNRGHLGHFLGDKECQVLAVCDVDTSRRESAKKTVDQRYADAIKSGSYKGCAAYNDFRDLIARKDIDAVVIATPDHWHAIPCLEAMKAKKDVYCEKPLTLTLAEAKVLIDGARKYDRVFQTGSQQRSSPEFRQACELVRSGRIGKLQAVYVNVGSPSKACDLPEEQMEPGLDWDRWLGQAPQRPYNAVLSPRGVHGHYPNWRAYREYSGGGMTDFGAHHFDIAQWGLGMDESGPVEVIPPEDPKAERGLRYLYANGVPVIHAEEYEKGKKFSGIAFIGSEGKIRVDRGFLASEPEGIIKTPLGQNDVHLYNSPGHQRDWVNCIRARKRPICDVEVGARSVAVCHLGNIAYWTHEKFKWDPKEWKFVDASPAVQKWYSREARKGYELGSL